MGLAHYGVYLKATSLQNELVFPGFVQSRGTTHDFATGSLAAPGEVPRQPSSLTQVFKNQAGKHHKGYLNHPQSPYSLGFGKGTASLKLCSGWLMFNVRAAARKG